MSAIFISQSGKDNAETDALAAWLGNQGHTAYFIDYDEKSGISAGIDWERLLYRRLRQCQAVIALVTPNWLASKWCFGEMVLALENGKPIFPIKLETCELPGLLSGIQTIDLTVDRESGYRRLALGLKEHGLDPTDVFVHDFTRPPYPGFAAFEEADAAVFFGRSAEILSARETFEGLRRHSRDVPRLLLVLGSSGSGKSSLVRAGLIPWLKKDVKNWLPLRPFRPQEQLSPLDALAFAIADTYKDLRLPCDSDLLRSRLHSAAESIPVDSGELLKIARALASAADRREATVLVTVDQAEELLIAGTPETAKNFLQFLGASLSASDPHLMVVASLRSDSLGVFHNRVASLDSGCRLGLEYRPLTVEPIPIERYADLIEGPARVAELELEDRLIIKLLRDAGTPHSLPLLAFTLRRLYDLRFEGPQANPYAKLTLGEYEEFGGLAGAVQNTADRIFGERQRTTEEINAIREAFIPGLIRYNEDRSYSRRRAFRHNLPPGARSLLVRFVDARILVASADEDGHATVEIAHEALMRTWPTLITWLAEDRDKLRQHDTIRKAAQEWDEYGRRDDLLVHRNERLKDAAALVSNRQFAFPAGSLESMYLDACERQQHAREELNASVSSLSRLSDAFGLSSLVKKTEEKIRQIRNTEKEYNALLAKWERLREQKAILQEKMISLKRQVAADAPKVFMSYAHEDVEAAKSLYNNLKRHGIQPWLDKIDLIVGSVWEQEITITIGKADFVVICISKRSITKRGFVQREIKLAIDTYQELPAGEVFLMPVRLEDCIVPGELSRFHYCDLFTENGLKLLIEGTREIRVILYAKDDPFCASASADELSIENILAVEHDVIPLDGADVFQQGEIDSIGDWVALTQDPGDFARLPVDDARQDQVQAAACVHLLPQLAGIDPAASPVKDVSGQGMELLDLEQAAPDASAQFRLREVLEDELGLEDAPEIPIGAVEPVLGAEAYQAFQSH